MHQAASLNHAGALMRQLNRSTRRKMYYCNIRRVLHEGRLKSASGRCDPQQDWCFSVLLLATQLDELTGVCWRQAISDAARELVLYGDKPF